MATPACPVRREYSECRLNASAAAPLRD